MKGGIFAEELESTEETIWEDGPPYPDALTMTLKSIIREPLLPSSALTLFLEALYTRDVLKKPQYVDKALLTRLSNRLLTNWPRINHRLKEKVTTQSIASRQFHGAWPQEVVANAEARVKYIEN